MKYLWSAINRNMQTMGKTQKPRIVKLKGNLHTAKKSVFPNLQLIKMDLTVA